MEEFKNFEIYGIQSIGKYYIYSLKLNRYAKGYHCYYFNSCFGLGTSAFSNGKCSCAVGSNQMSDRRSHRIWSARYLGLQMFAQMVIQ